MKKIVFSSGFLIYAMIVLRRIFQKFTKKSHRRLIIWIFR